MRVLAQLPGLEGIDLDLVVKNPRLDLEKLRALSEPAPLLQRARRHVLPRRQLILRQLRQVPAPCLTADRTSAIRFVPERYASLVGIAVDEAVKSVT